MFGLAVGLEALANCMDGIRGHCWNHCTGLRETIRPTNQAHHQTLGLQLARQAQAWIKHLLDALKLCGANCKGCLMARQLGICAKTYISGSCTRWYGTVCKPPAEHHQGSSKSWPSDQAKKVLFQVQLFHLYPLACLCQMACHKDWAAKQVSPWICRPWALRWHAAEA